MKKNLESLDLVPSLDAFKFASEHPQLFLSEYFMDLKNQINIEAEKTLSNENNINNNVNKFKINKKRHAMIEQINSFEKECLTNCSTKIKNEDNLNFNINIKDISTEQELKQFEKLKRRLFLNRNMIFITPISVTGPLSDCTAFGKLIYVKKYNI